MNIICIHVAGKFNQNISILLSLKLYLVTLQYASNLVYNKTVCLNLYKKRNCIGISVFCYESKKKHQIYLSKNTIRRHVDLSLIGEQGKGHYVLIKDFDTFIYGHKLHRRR